MSVGGVSVDGKAPPHDLDAEAALLSAILIGDLATLDECEGIVSPGDCYAESHRWILTAMESLGGARSPVDVVQVAGWLKAQTDAAGRSRLDQCGGMAYLVEILNAAPAVANVSAYARRVRDLRLVRDSIARMQRRIAQAYLGINDVRAYLDGCETDIAELSGARQQSAGDLTLIGESLAEVWREIKEQHKAGTVVTGLSTGFDRVDRITAGLHEGELTVIAARPGMGKTSYLMALAVNAAAAGLPAAVFSVEMPKRQLVRRALAAHAYVDLQKMRNAGLRDPDWKRLGESCRTMHKLPLYVDDTPSLSLREARTKLKRLNRNLEKKGTRLRFAAFDYIQLMRGERGSQNREQEIASLSRGLKELSKELHIPVIGLAQLNRGVEGRAEKRPTIPDLRESGAIEQDADNIQFLYREAYYATKEARGGRGSDPRDEPPVDNTAEVIIAKQRNGPTGTVKVKFNAWCTGFENLEEDNS